MKAGQRFPLLRALMCSAALALASCGGESEQAGTGAAPNPLLRPRQFTATAPETYRVRLETTAGDVVIDVHRAWAPLGADRFHNLVRAGFYDDTRIYRVVEGFMAQFGLNGDPYVNQAWKTQYLVDDPVTQPNTRGRVGLI